MTDNRERASNLDWVKRPPRGLAHELTAGGCPGFTGGEHSDECNKLTKALIDYGRWRELKGRDTGRTAIDDVRQEALEEREAENAALRELLTDARDYVRARHVLRHKGRAVFTDAAPATHKLVKDIDEALAQTGDSIVPASR